MYKITCKMTDDCTYEATGDTKEEAVESMLKHNRETHPEEMGDTTDEDARADYATKVSEE